MITDEQIAAVRRQLPKTVCTCERCYPTVMLHDALDELTAARLALAARDEEIARLTVQLAERDAACAAMRGALELQDPRRASELYDRIADDFYRKTRMWPPGRSAPLAMNVPDASEEVRAAWRRFCDAWHEQFFDAALAPDSGRALLAEMERLRRIEAAARGYVDVTARFAASHATIDDLRNAFLSQNAALTPAPAAEADHE